MAEPQDDDDDVAALIADDQDRLILDVLTSIAGDTIYRG